MRAHREPDADSGRGSCRPRQEHRRGPDSGGFRVAARRQARAGPRAVRAHVEALRIRLPARRAQGRARPGHHDRRGARLLQECPPSLRDHRRPRARRVPQEHGDRRVTGRGRPARRRRARGRAGELAPPRHHADDARRAPGGGAGQQDGPGGVVAGGLRRHRRRDARLHGARADPGGGVRAGLGPRGRQPGDRSADMPWYAGPTVLEVLDGFATPPAPSAAAFRMAVQDVYRFTKFGDDRRIVAGTIDSGTLRRGRRRRVLSLWQALARAVARGLPPAAPAGRGRRRGHRLHARSADLHHARRGGGAGGRAAAAGDDAAARQPLLARSRTPGAAQGLRAAHGHGARADAGGARGAGARCLHARHRRPRRGGAPRGGRLRAHARPAGGRRRARRATPRPAAS